MLSAYAQKEGNIWYFGNKAGVDFNSGGPVAIHNSVMNTGHGCACISDKCSGEMLFYTDGTTVWDSTHTPMPNGSGLFGDQLSTQSAIIVPHPDTSKNTFFIFTVEQSGSGGMHYSMVDMDLNGGKGDVVTASKNTPLVTPTVEKLTAVKHRNNVDVWVITHQLNSNAFYAYLVTPAGLSNSPVISRIGTSYTADAIQGYLKASPDGQHLAAAFRNKNSLELYDFDYASGEVSNAISFPDTYPGAYGIEFSPDGSKLYLTINSNGLFQFDLKAGSATDIINSEIQLSTVPAVALQLGPDRKIYTNEGRWLGVINDPDASGLACNYVPQTVSLGGAVFGNSGLPTFLQSYFSPISIVESNLCIGSQTSFSLSNLEQVDSLFWNFGDPSSGVDNTSIEVAPEHTYSASGNFPVQVIYYGSICGNTVADTLEKTITIENILPPAIDLGADTSICQGQQVELKISSPLASYRWQDGSTDSIYTATDDGTYFVEVTNLCGTDSDSIDIFYFVSTLKVDLGNDTSFCSGNSLVLDVQQEGATAYTWNDGSSGSTNFINSEGTFWVTISDRCSSISDTIRVDVLLPPRAVLNVRDTSICPGTLLELDATFEGAQYKWQDGSTEAIYVVEDEGTYFVNISNQCGRSRAIVDVSLKDCNCTVFVPSAFTPNGDERNNEFRVTYDCDFSFYELNIFTRWGERIYQTRNPLAAWDGSSLPAGAYVYQLRYQTNSQGQVIEKNKWGNVTLIR